MWPLVWLLAATAADAGSDVKSDEEVLFFLTCASRADSGWNLPVHGLIFEPERSSFRRKAALELLCSLLGLGRQDAQNEPVGRVSNSPYDRQDAQNEIFQQRARWFLVDNERGKSIRVRLGGRVYPAGTSAANGHFTNTLQIDQAEADRLRRTEADPAGWLTFQAVLRRGDKRQFTGRVQLVDPQGRSVISDVDDTIKITEVRDRQAMLANTFLRPLRPVPGMAALYRQWADRGMVFHYVSASPWQLYAPLAEFLAAERFPAGSFHLKLFRLKDSTALNLLGPQTKYKTEVIERILAEFPGRRFIFVGDSGEQDPETYASIARKHPGQIEHIFIRNVGGAGSEPSRFQQAFEGIPREKRKLFEKASELPDFR